MPRSRPVLALLGVVLVSGLGLSACGGDGGEAGQPPPKVDHSDQIAELQRQKQRLSKRIQAKRRAATEAATESSGGESNAGLVELLAGLSAEAGVVVGAPGGGSPGAAAGGLETGPAWSTIKVPIVERVLEDAGGPSGVTSAQADQIHRAITLSDNDAAAALFDGLESRHGGLAGGSAAVGEMLRQAGDTQTVVSTEGRDGFSTYGQTEWSLDNQFQYMAALAGGCISDPATRKYLLDQMAQVGGSDLYGLGSTGVPARWKGGWGPGLDGRYLVRQMGVMETDGGPLVVAMAAIPQDGTFESGQAALTEIASWISANASSLRAARTAC